jgi:hypothetical protein
MREHWSNCITHFDKGVGEFAEHYFANAERRALVVAGAGFDPRARRIAELLSALMPERVDGLFIREDRGDPAQNLLDAANENEAALTAVLPKARIERVVIFAEDGAPVAGARVGEMLRSYEIPKHVTDVVLDMSALSIGVAFPLARFLLSHCEERDLNLHIMIVSNPELDAHIRSEPDDRVINARGFAGPAVASDARVAKIWAPQLSHRKASALSMIRNAAGEQVYKTCPILPFPARNPRRADDLISEFGEDLEAWDVDARDLIYVSERNPLDSYRTLSTLKKRYDQTVDGVFTPQIILSPVGSKVMAAGAMMAAIEHDLTVQYVETLRYDFEQQIGPLLSGADLMVHVWLCGPIYAGYAAAEMG